MAVLPLIHFPNGALREKAKKVKKIDKSVDRLIEDLIDTLEAAGGVGLASNQIGVLRRVIVIHLPEEEEPRVYINPEITHKEGAREVTEGCLSVPGYSGLITRAIWVKAQGMDRQWKLVKLKADGLLAQALEHEIDHLNGILYLDHLKSHEDLMKHEPEPPAADEEGPAAVEQPAQAAAI